MEAIRKSETTLDAKRLGSHVLESDAWISFKDTMIIEIWKQSYSSVPNLKMH